MKKKALFFDLDDTLLDNFTAFKRTLADLTPTTELNEENYVILYQGFRGHSEAIYETTLATEDLVDDYELARWDYLLTKLGISYTTTDLKQFDDLYHHYQSQGKLPHAYQELFHQLHEAEILVGVFTNGFSKAQRAKINQLELTRHIPDEWLIVSDDFGNAKPNVSCFRELKDHLPSTIDDYYYVGDSYKNDIAPSQQAGWHPIWLNRFAEKSRGHEKIMVKTIPELIAKIQTII